MCSRQQNHQRSRSISRNRRRSRSRNRSRFVAHQIANGKYMEVVVVKNGSVLGLTVSDGSNGLVYIRRVRPNTVCYQLRDRIHAGDQIQKVNGESMVGKRHFQVARLLRDIPMGRIITLGLLSADVPELVSVLPTTIASSSVSAPTMAASLIGSDAFSPYLLPSSVSSAIEPSDLLSCAIEPSALSTLSSAIEPSAIEEPIFVEEKQEVDAKEEAVNKKLVECINKIFEEYLGFDDDELALSVWKLASDCKNLFEMSSRIRESEELSQFEFPEELVFDMWGIVDDFKNKRLNSTEFEMQD